MIVVQQTWRIIATSSTHPLLLLPLSPLLSLFSFFALGLALGPALAFALAFASFSYFYIYIEPNRKAAKRTVEAQEIE